MAPRVGIGSPGLIALAVALSACASGTSTRVELTEVADEAQVKGCTYLQDVSGREGWWYGVLGQVSGEYAHQGLEDARSVALRRAKEIGATHVVWLPNVEGRASLQVSAKAYRCGAEGQGR
jgi:hypothetical protein